ncbi:MAG TPA: hypothetical protein VM492_12425, partial [Sumerlaeia bacterium]|nr:hypothetical protein [Sumerlaeia bacterium]
RPATPKLRKTGAFFMFATAKASLNAMESELRAPRRWRVLGGDPWRTIRSRVSRSGRSPLPL